VLYEGRRYPPKAVLGFAAGKAAGTPLGPSDFKGGLNSKCFRILEANGFTIVTKGDQAPFPDEIDESIGYPEGAVQRITVNRYERDPYARTKAIEHHGLRCKVCNFDFETIYGSLGQGFIHVHHIVKLSDVGETYIVDPKKDLIPVCPNWSCNAAQARIPIHY
jgi:5-methylcytosine-specific restriction protein A